MKIICVGKLKENYWKEAVIEYRKRLTKYIHIEIQEVADINLPDINKSLSQEELEILKLIKEKDYVITLEITGKSYDSLEFAQCLNRLQVEHSSLVFVIGGSNGLGETIKKRANLTLSFSKMTFPHQLFRVMLLEQLYRGYKIMNNEKYHK